MSENTMRYITRPGHLVPLRRNIEKQYVDHPTECGGSFDEILDWEIHTNGLTFVWLAKKWGISLALLGELIAEHCCGLEALPRVRHDLSREQLADITYEERSDHRDQNVTTSSDTTTGIHSAIQAVKDAREHLKDAQAPTQRFSHEPSDDCDSCYFSRALLAANLREDDAKRRQHQ